MAERVLYAFSFEKTFDGALCCRRFVRILTHVVCKPCTVSARSREEYRAGPWRFRRWQLLGESHSHSRIPWLPRRRRAKPSDFSRGRRKCHPTNRRAPGWSGHLGGPFLG